MARSVVAPKRRTLLAALAVASSAGTGCLDRLSGDETRLGAFPVTNRDTEPHRFALRVRDDGDAVHRSTHEVRGRGDGSLHGATAPGTWDGAAGDYEVGVRVDDGEWTTRRLADETEFPENVDCLRAQAEYDPDGDLWFRFPEDCERFDGRWLAGSPCTRTDGSADGRLASW